MFSSFLMSLTNGNFTIKCTTDSDVFYIHSTWISNPEDENMPIVDFQVLNITSNRSYSNTFTNAALMNLKPSSLNKELFLSNTFLAFTKNEAGFVEVSESTESNISITWFYYPVANIKIPLGTMEFTCHSHYQLDTFLDQILSKQRNAEVVLAETEQQLHQSKTSFDSLIIKYEDLVQQKELKELQDYKKFKDVLNSKKFKIKQILEELDASKLKIKSESVDSTRIKDEFDTQLDQK
ncbi:hypothetical protein BC833DRAFT_603074 [Globomyces pollinis-pini]|nr:hypothetical protein BC833DRAFT_603074 [Globomyces pollinis-pini]